MTALPPLAPRAALRWDVVQRLVAALAPRTVLEVGCGQGGFGARLADHAAYLGLEPDPTSYAVAAARIEPRGGEVRNTTTADLPPGAAYDLVCAFEVLEHLEDDRAALTEWVELARPGGHVLLSVPAHQARFGPMDVAAGHFRRYSPDRLATLASDCGLTDVRVVLYGWPLGYALEAVRNRVDLRDGTSEASMAERTASSGRFHQPRRTATGVLVAGAVTPFRWLQRLRPTTGVGLVVLGRRPG